MRKLGLFIFELYKKIRDNEIMPLATQLTYRLVFSLFPFLIFLISLVGFFDWDADVLLNTVSDLFPEQIAAQINEIIHQVVDTRNPSIMSTSLIMYLFTVSNGFRAVMRGINRAYGYNDNRKSILRWIYCTILVMVLAVAIIISMLVVVFGDSIYELVTRFVYTGPWLTVIFGFAGVLVVIAIMLATIMLIYRLSCAKPQSFIELLPGAIITIAVWAISSAAFNFWINNFSSYSLIYGSIASIFITMLWLNIISTVILIGAQVNALINVQKTSSDN